MRASISRSAPASATSAISTCTVAPRSRSESDHVLRCFIGPVDGRSARFVPAPRSASHPATAPPMPPRPPVTRYVRSSRSCPVATGDGVRTATSPLESDATKSAAAAASAMGRRRGRGGGSSPASTRRIASASATPTRAGSLSMRSASAEAPCPASSAARHGRQRDGGERCRRHAGGRGYGQIRAHHRRRADGSGSESDHPVTRGERVHVGRCVNDSAADQANPVPRRQWLRPSRAPLEPRGGRCTMGSTRRSPPASRMMCQSASSGSVSCGVPCTPRTSLGDAPVARSVGHERLAVRSE